jgi:hypothetical protein
MVAHTTTYKGFDIEAIYDYDIPNPRKEFHQLTTITAIKDNFHLGGLDLGPNDFHATSLIEAISEHLPESDGFACEDDFYEWDDKLTEEDYMEYLIEQFSEYAFVLPVYVQTHGTVNMYAGSSAAELSTDMTAFISIPKHIAQQTWPQCVDESDRLEKVAIQSMSGEVEIYSKWVSGEVYMYSIEDPKGYVDEDACGGFYGLSACVDGAKEAINGWMWKEKHDKRLKYIMEGIREKMIAAKYLFFPTVVTTA